MENDNSASNFVLLLSLYSGGLRTGGPGFDYRQEARDVFFSTATRSALRPTQPAIQWAAGALSPEVKRPERDAGN
jgi:hypothetical protein